MRCFPKETVRGEGARNKGTALLSGCYPRLKHIVFFVAHGTAVAGLIAAGSADTAGLSGVAPGASITGYEVDWTPEALALMLKKQLDPSTGGVDLSNNSWGFLKPFADDFDSP
ncbi:MAG: hypothetical protein EBZ22_05775, partial [Flavobacteriia bacterium]|nr:hypothetical protein [Flavobacteriia bacterium]